MPRTAVADGHCGRIATAVPRNPAQLCRRCASRVPGCAAKTPGPHARVQATPNCAHGLWHNGAEWPGTGRPCETIRQGGPCGAVDCRFAVELAMALRRACAAPWRTADTANSGGQNGVMCAQWQWPIPWAMADYAHGRPDIAHATPCASWPAGRCVTESAQRTRASTVVLVADPGIRWTAGTMPS